MAAYTGAVKASRSRVQAAVERSLQRLLLSAMIGAVTMLLERAMRRLIESAPAAGIGGNSGKSLLSWAAAKLQHQAAGEGAPEGPERDGDPAGRTLGVSAHRRADDRRAGAEGQR